MSKLWTVAVLGFGMVGGLSAVSQETTTLDGWISDSMDAPSHVGSGVKECIDAGAKPVFVSDAGKKTYAIDNPDAVKGHWGHHVALTGTLDSSKNTIHVATTKMLKSQTPPTGAGKME